MMQDRDAFADAAMAVAGLNTCRQMVKDFHLEVVDNPPAPMPTVVESAIASSVEEVEYAAESMLDAFKNTGDQRYLRAHLVLEEAAELVKAMGKGDEVEVLDALADLTYVTVGTAVQFDLPLGAAFVEVHSSNMTKAKQHTDKDGCRIRDKGSNYVPPGLARVLKEYRERQRLEEELRAVPSATGTISADPCDDQVA